MKPSSTDRDSLGCALLLALAAALTLMLIMGKGCTDCGRRAAYHQMLEDQQEVNK